MENTALAVLGLAALCLIHIVGEDTLHFVSNREGIVAAASGGVAGSPHVLANTNVGFIRTPGLTGAAVSRGSAHVDSAPRG